jgi:hypothetical protein
LAKEWVLLLPPGDQGVVFALLEEFSLLQPGWRNESPDQGFSFQKQVPSVLSIASVYLLLFEFESLQERAGEQRWD